MATAKHKREKGLSVWQPFGELEEMGRRFEDILGWPLLPRFWRRFPLEEVGWVPALDIFEKEDKFVVKAELPGMEEDDIDVSVAGDILTIKGEKRRGSEVNKEDYYCCEQSYGSFSRSIALPSTVNAGEIDASYDNGVLEVILPKASEVKPKKIKVASKKK